MTASSATTARIHPCPKCGSEIARIVEGKGPHAAGLRCFTCDRFIQWISKDRAALIQEGHNDC